MKKTGVILTLACLLFLCANSRTFAKTYEENGFQYEVHKKQATIVGGEMKGSSLNIPATIGGFPVIKVGSLYSAYKNTEKCTSIILPDSVREIGEGAFRGFKNVKSIRLSKNLVKIRTGAFEKCTGLTSLKFDKGLKEIESYAFEDCINLKTVSLPSTVEKMGESVFSNCYKLSSVTLGKNLKKISRYAFYKNYALKSIVIPSRVGEVEDKAFYKCDSLKKVVFKSGSTKLGEAVFKNCSELKKMTLPKKMKTIPVSTFENCSKLKSFRLGKNVTIIKKNAFRGCRGLKKVNLNKKVYAIGDRAFADSGLSGVKLNKNMQFVGNGAFSNTKIKKIAFQNKVTYIGNRVFADCSQLKKIVIPASVKGINPGAFNNCRRLSNIQVAGGNAMYCSQAGVLYDKSKTKLIQYPLHKTNRTFQVPASVKTIRQRAFEDNNYLQSVTIHAETIGESAFANMGKLRSVKMASGVKKIGRNAFYDSSDLTSVTLPDSLETIENGAFFATSIRKFYIPSRLKKLGADALEECRSLNQFTGGRGGAYKVQNGVLYNKKMTTLIKYPAKRKDKSFVVPNTVQRIAGEAFAYAKYLRKLEFGKNLQTLSYRAIYRANQLKSIVFTSRKFSYGAYGGVSECDNLAVIVGPSTYSLTSLARNANATLIAL